jgi:multidrug resistance efflux pump
MTRRPYRCLLGVLALGTLAAGLAGQDLPPRKAPTKKPATLPRQQAMEQFRKLSPQERLARVEKLALGKQAFVTVTRADLDVTVTERGTVESSDAADVVCPLRARSKDSPVAGTIKWVIEDGTRVKKDQRLLELDDSELRDQLRGQKIEVDRATADKLAAELHLKVVRTQNKLAIRTAELSLKMARLQRKKYTGDDKDEKEIHDLQVEITELSLESIKLTSKAKEMSAEADLKARAAVAELQAKQARALEAQIAACVIKAPQDGMVTYYVPEQSRFGPKAPVVAVGEPVREGQKLLRISGLERFTVATRVHEALVHRVRAGQSVAVRVDAFPGRVLRGRVTAVARVASQADWMWANVKVYPVQVEIIDKLPGLKPGMTAEVRIEVERRLKVLQVPAESVVQSNRESFCFVKTAKGLQERKVTTGAGNDQNREVTDGLKENEQVLRFPDAAAVISEERR